MPPRPQEREAQRYFVLQLRARIDLARKYPSTRNVREAVEYAQGQPLALRSSHVRHNLGSARWSWLADHGIAPVGEPGEADGSFKATITPEVTK
jgi:hypothetical protein